MCVSVCAVVCVRACVCVCVCVCVRAMPCACRAPAEKGIAVDLSRRRQGGDLLRVASRRMHVASCVVRVAVPFPGRLLRHISRHHCTAARRSHRADTHGTRTSADAHTHKEHARTHTLTHSHTPILTPTSALSLEPLPVCSPLRLPPSLSLSLSLSVSLLRNATFITHYRMRSSRRANSCTCRRARSSSM